MEPIAIHHSEDFSHKGLHACLGHKVSSKMKRGIPGFLVVMDGSYRAAFGTLM